jgi:S-adenosylmethionine:tRNA ribosyltransferase-isomerase
VEAQEEGQEEVQEAPEEALIRGSMSDFDLSAYAYDLPDAQIARFPATRRDGSRLLVLGAQNGAVAHHAFDEILEHLPPRALLVLNDTRVVPARIPCHKASGGAAELFFVEPAGGGQARCLLRASRRPRPGAVLTTARGGLEVELLADEGKGVVLARFPVDHDEALPALLEQVGEVPLPPYLRREAGPDDLARYQTVYARAPGAVAAPTAGLHFTPALLAEVEARGHDLARVTLHVGPGTFRPVEVDDIRDHEMHGERYEISAEAAARINAARAEGRPILAVGTTSVRTLEAAARDGRVQAGQGVARLFIYPGFRLQIVDHLLTNFHLPGSTLIMMVAAITGREPLLAAYREAVTEGYRFYSYGDAMLVRGDG